MGDGSNGRIAELISAAVLAGAYGALARQMPDAARGLGRMREKHSARVAALASEICAGAGLKTQASRVMPRTGR